MPSRRRFLPSLLLALCFAVSTGAIGAADAPLLYWLPEGASIEGLPEAAELYYEGLAGRLVGVGIDRVADLEARGGVPLALYPGEVIFVALVEDAERASFEPPSRVLIRSGREVLLACSKDAPRLTEPSERGLQGLKEYVRIDGHSIPWSQEEPVPPAGPREIDPLIAEMVEALTEADYVSLWQPLDDFETRYTYAQANEQATQWILEQFQSYGLDAEFHYYNQSGPRRNVIATLPGLVEPSRIVYIVGHLDAISGTPEVCAPGADDNGSGTSAVLAAARVFSQFAFQYTIKFACFNGEEQGLVGSAAYVADIAAAGEDVIGAFNCDMIAYRGTDPAPPDLVVYTNNNSVALATTLENAINDYLPGLLDPVVHVEALNASDHASFWAHGYKAICSIEDEAWGDDFCPWYHTCEDRIERYPTDYATYCAKANLAAVATTALPINPEGTFLAFGSTEISDDQIGGSSGNGDGDPNPGETIELWVTIRNLGQQDAHQVSGILGTESEYATILDGDAAWNDIPAGGQSANLTPFLLTVSADAPDAEILSFTLSMTDDQGVRDVNVPLQIVAPVLAHRSHVLDDVPHGNGNGIPDPGEVLVIPVRLANTGGQDAVSVIAILTSSNPHVVLIDDEAASGWIGSGSEGELSPPYRIALSVDAIDGEVIPFALEITAGFGYSTVSGFSLRVGSYFFDDVEADGAWSLSAPDDDATTGRWVRVDPNGTEYDGSPAQSEDDHSPPPGTDCFVTGQGSVGGTAGENDVDGGKTTLISPPFDLTRVSEPRISYWRWYTNNLGNNPGEDLWVVQISRDGGSTWFDLERTTASANSWQERSFLVSDYVTPSNQIVVRFIASDEGGGSLVESAVDDFVITGEGGTVAAGDPSPVLTLRLDPARPNPVVDGTSLTFALPAASTAAIRLYGVDGRLVRTLVDRDLEAGIHQVGWDGRNAGGAQVAPGIYFVRLRAEGQELTRRLVLVR